MIRVSRGRCLLQYWLDKRGLTQAEYARRVGRHKRVISHFCNDELIMKPEDEYAGSLVLNCEMKDLHEWNVEYIDID